MTSSKGGSCFPFMGCNRTNLAADWASPVWLKPQLRKWRPLGRPNPSQKLCAFAPWEPALVPGLHWYHLWVGMSCYVFVVAFETYQRWPGEPALNSWTWMLSQATIISLVAFPFWHHSLLIVPAFKCIQMPSIFLNSESMATIITNPHGLMPLLLADASRQCSALGLRLQNGSAEAALEGTVLLSSLSDQTMGIQTKHSLGRTGHSFGQIYAMESAKTRQEFEGYPCLIHMKLGCTMDWHVVFDKPKDELINLDRAWCRHQPDPAFCGGMIKSTTNHHQPLSTNFILFINSLWSTNYLPPDNVNVLKKHERLMSGSLEDVTQPSWASTVRSKVHT